MGTDRDAHRYYEGMAVAHVVGGLGEADGRVFRSHLLECSDCRARVGELRALAHDLADVERDERRVRSPAAVETKSHEPAEAGEEDGGQTEGPRRSAPGMSGWVPRVLAVLGLITLVGLAGWTFVLRATVANLESVVDDLTAASVLLQFGEKADVTTKHEDLEATVSTDGERLALLVDGLTAGERYQVFLTDQGGDVVDSDTPVEARNGRLFVLVPMIGDARRAVVSPAPGRAMPEPDEHLVTAELP